MDLKDSLKRYKDPSRAGRVWIDYYDEIHSYGGAGSALEILGECTDPDMLDVRLDLLLTQLRTGGKRSLPPKRVEEDLDSGGFYSNASRAREES